MYPVFPMIYASGTIFAALLGLAFGSFLNVCASRWPQGESIVRPASHCRACGRSLRWWENLPLLSWLALRGRCRTCHAWVGWRYPLVELAVAVTWAVASWQTLTVLLAPGTTAPDLFDALAFGLIKMILCWLLICLAVLDAEHLWLPDWLTLGGAALGLLVSVARFVTSWIWRSLPLHWSLESGPVTHRAHLYDAVVMWLLGLLLIPGSVLLIRWTYRTLRKREGVGLGDVKLALMLAAWLGFSRTLLSFFVGIVVGGVVGVAMLMLPARGQTRKRGLIKLPFGAFLCGGGIVAALWGGDIIAAYLRWCGF